MGEAYFHKYDESLKKYLGSELYCREERQYAVFLYNIFLKKKMAPELIKPFEEKIIKKCLDSSLNPEDKIKDVYFEATLMRDYFEKDRKGFNEALLSFCLDWLPKGSTVISDLKDLGNIYSVNFGQKNFKDLVNLKYEDLNKFNEDPDKFNEDISAEERKKAKEKACLDIARMMMNATPDLLVVYTKGGTTYAKALECKYESDEGRYKDIVGAECKMQLFIQECIMHFCFGNSENEKGKYIPPFPGKSKRWKGKKSLWEHICLYVYKGILEQNTKTDDVKNAGVEMVRFCRPTKENENIGIEVYVEPGKSHTSEEDKNKWRKAKTKKEAS